jgi:hypothetical protein
MSRINDSPQTPEIRRSSWQRPTILFGVILLIVVGAFVVFLTAVIGVVIFHATTPDSRQAVGTGAFIIGSVITAPLWFLGFRLVKRANRHDWASAEELLNKDRRPPVLYLRPFDVDQQADQVDSGVSALASTLYFPSALSRLVKEFRNSTDEMMWSAALSSIGPVVAVATPGQLPFRGAARLFVGDGDWQQAVASLASQAALTVVMGGETDGLWWEIKNIVSALSEDKVVYLLPNDELEFVGFRARMLRELGIDIGDKPNIAHHEMVCAVLQLIQGKAQLIPIWGSSQSSIELALEPVVKRLAID